MSAERRYGPGDISGLNQEKPVIEIYSEEGEIRVFDSNIPTSENLRKILQGADEVVINDPEDSYSQLREEVEGHIEGSKTSFTYSVDEM